MTDPLLRLFDPAYGLLTIATANRAGVTNHQIAAAVRAGRIDRLWRGVYALPVPDSGAGRRRRLVQQAVAAASGHRHVAVSHLAAADLRALPTWAERPRPCVTTGLPGLTAVGTVHVHRVPTLSTTRTSERLLVVDAARTVADIAAEFGVESGLVSADAAVRSGATSRADLEIAAASVSGTTGAAAARAVARAVDPAAESVLETRSRWRCGRAGLPPPWTQVDIHDLDGRFVARVDLYWDEFGVVGEADGRVKYRRDRTRSTSERFRHEALVRLGLGHVSWGWADLDTFDVVAADLRAAFGEAGHGPRRWRAVRSVVRAA